MAFHIHVPKPLHGWKAFLNEIMVIVIGVLIALGLEAIVEELHWRHKAEDGRKRLQLEMTANFGFAAEQAEVTPCILAQLDRLRAHLSQPGAAGTPMPVDHFPDNDAVLRLPTRSWVSNTWEALLQDGTASHLTEREQRYIGSFYGQASVMMGQVIKSGDAMGQMIATSFPAQLGQPARDQLLIAIAEQYRRTQYMGRLSGQMMATMRDLGLQPSDAQVADQLGRTYASNTLGYCKAQGLPVEDWHKAMARVPGLAKRSI